MSGDSRQPGQEEVWPPAIGHQVQVHPAPRGFLHNLGIFLLFYLVLAVLFFLVDSGASIVIGNISVIDYHYDWRHIARRSLWMPGAAIGLFSWLGFVFSKLGLSPSSRRPGREKP